jgi:radical SAM superfamily enzyme YgiQ (UPF0313 family)
MRITFIRPNMIPERQTDAMQPLAFAILAGLTPPDIDLSLYDDRIEDIDYDEPTDLVAFSVETYTAKRAYDISARFRAKGVPVVMGGFHATFEPDEILEHADAVVMGDAEGTWPQVITDLKNGCLQRRYHNPVAHMNGVRYPRDIFRGKKYSRILPVQYSRGCKFDCDFCSISAFYSRRLMQRPMQEVIDEIAGLESRYIFITDDNIFINRKLAREFFTALIPLKVKWMCQVSMDVTNDDALMSLMSRSGCVAAIVGFESLEKGNLALMNKAINARNDYEAVVRKFQNHGIMIFGTFVLGYDHDTSAVFDRTLAFAEESKFMIAQFNPLMPMPGTRLYERLKEEDRLIFERWWLDERYSWGDALFVPKLMTPGELKEGCWGMRSRFYSVGSIAKRLLSFRNNARNLQNIFLFLLINIVSRLEIRRKMGSKLGTDRKG